MKWWDEEECLLEFIESDFYIIEDPFKNITIYEMYDDTRILVKKIKTLKKYLETL